MKFDEFLEKAWTDHGTLPSEVALTFPSGAQLIESDDQIPMLAHLVTHVYGEHLGKWDDGIDALRRLTTLTVFESAGESGKAILRSVATLELCGGKRSTIADFTISDRIRILAVATTALYERGAPEKAKAYFVEAIGLAGNGVAKEDPANRALAVAGNNLACALEEKKERNPAETELMILAAKTGRRFWEVAGTWRQMLWAEYRLVQTYAKAGDSIRSLEHKRICTELARLHIAELSDEDKASLLGD